MFYKKNIPYPLLKSGLLLSSLSLIFFSSILNKVHAKEQITVSKLQSQAIENCKVYSKVQMMSLLDVSIKLDGSNEVLNNIQKQNNSILVKSNLNNQFKSIYKNCVRINYNKINLVRVGNIDKAYQKYQKNYDTYKGYLDGFYKSIDNQKLIKAYSNIFN